MTKTEIKKKAKWKKRLQHITKLIKIIMRTKNIIKLIKNIINSI